MIAQDLKCAVGQFWPGETGPAFPVHVARGKWTGEIAGFDVATEIVGGGHLRCDRRDVEAAGMSFQVVGPAGRPQKMFPPDWAATSVGKV